MSELQRDIDTVKRALLAANPLPSEADFAFERIRQRLSPDREAVARAIVKAMRLHPDHYVFFLNEADAAINAMGEA